MTKTITIVVASFFLLLAGVSQSQSDARAQVMIFGVFHFANPGRDVVKTETVNVLTEESQRYLKDLSMRLREFRPTVVLLEFDPANEAVMQERYEEYLDDKFELPVNEIYQLGFRIAKVSGVEKIGSFDEKEIGWDAEPLFDYLSEHDLETERAFQLAIEQYSAEQQRAHSELALGQILEGSNNRDQDRLNKSLYLVTNQVGKGENFVGADAAARWWHRNFRMYARIQRQATPGQRVLVIGGQGHTAILKDFLEFDADRDAVDVLPYL